GGIGVREAAFAALCARFGVAPDAAAAASLAWQGVLAAGSLLAGVGWVAASRAQAARRGRSNGSTAVVT
ncbi:MAG TPA: hypothetical protein VEI02_13590, partial [Planctomycetota bacterium]|nr:hypothetical protein [Planctomycetota bacterium]